MDRKTPLEPGYRVEVINFSRRNAKAIQKEINDFMSDTSREARAAGYKFRLQSVTAGPYENAIIAYELTEDPGFRPPM